MESHYCHFLGTAFGKPDAPMRASRSRASMRTSASTRSLADMASPTGVAHVHKQRCDDVRSIEMETLTEEGVGIRRDVATDVATSRIYVISSSFVRWFICRLHETRLIQSTWRDLFMHCIPTIQSLLTTRGLSEAAWTFALQPYRAISAQIVRLVDKLKQAVYECVTSPTGVSSWLVECFMRCAQEARMLGSWVSDLLAGLTNDATFADRLTLMGLTNAAVVGGMLADNEMPTLDADRTLEERRTDILAQMKRAALASVLYEDRLLSGLVRCLVQRLREDGAISPVEYTEWMTDASIERFTRHLQRHGCTSYGLCRFVLSASLDLRKTQFVQTLEQLPREQDAHPVAHPAGTNMGAHATIMHDFPCHMQMLDGRTNESEFQRVVL